MKVGECLFIKTDDGKLTLPETIEFSERMVLYRRGILQPPEPREIELSAQVMSGSGVDKTVRVRWKALGARAIALYQDGAVVGGEFLPSDEYEATIQRTTHFRVVADYGNGETTEAQTQASVTPIGGIYSVGTGTRSTANEQTGIFQVKPNSFDL